MRNSVVIKKYAIIVFAFILLYIIETVPQYAINYGRITPEILIPFALVLSMREGEKTGAIAGLAVGLLYDTQSAGIMGFFSVLLMFFGYFTGRLMIFLLRRNALTALYLCAIWVLVPNYLFYFFFYYLYGSASPLFVTVDIILPKIITALVFVLIFHFAGRIFYKRFPEFEQGEK